MKRNPPYKAGYSLVELILVMALLIFLGISTFTLMMASNHATQGMIAGQDHRSELRIASSYVTTRLRQHDEAEAISIGSHPTISGEALVIEELYYGEKFENWIYYQEGALKEIIISPDQVLRDDFAYIIAEIDSFSITMDPELSGLWVHMSRQGQTKEYSVEWFHHLKASEKSAGFSALDGGEAND